MADCNPIFHQLLLLPGRHDFRKIEKDRFRPKRKCRTRNRRARFAVMRFAQITRRSGSRDIVRQFELHAAKLYYYGLGHTHRIYEFRPLPDGSSRATEGTAS